MFFMRIGSFARLFERVESGRRARFAAAAPLRLFLGLSLGLPLCLSLGACMTSTNAEPSTFINECPADRGEIVADVDWDKVQPYKMRIVNGDFRPMIWNVEQGRPYVLIIENADDKDHDFWAPDFLKTGVALESIQFGDRAPGKGCVNGVRLKARSKVVMRFVPMWEGRYEARDVNFVLTPTIGATVILNVVPPRVGVAAN